MSCHTGALRPELVILFVEPQLGNGESSPSWAGDQMPAQDLVLCGLFKSVLEKGGPLVVALSNCGCQAGPEVGGKGQGWT